MSPSSPRPADYPPSPKNFPKNSGGALSPETKWRLAQKAFATTAAYDSAIASTLERITADFHLPPTDNSFPQTLRLSFQKTLDLRYGENPHQKAAMYSDGSGVGVANARQIQGKELSYNNIVDLQAAWDLAQEFPDEPVCAIIKHTNPCRRRDRQDSRRSLQARALECDPVSAFGGVIGVNRPIDAEAAEEMHKLFLEVIAAPVSMKPPKLDSPPRKIFAWSKSKLRPKNGF
jgi:phosphoribosylaminoimidazolecarboxamide formyltransferase/IMP cyclohydrolase